MIIFKIAFLLGLTVSMTKASFVNDSIRTLEKFLVNFETSLSVNAFVCWESGEKDQFSMRSLKIFPQITQYNSSER